MSQTERRLINKVYLLGNSAVGTTSLVRRFVEGRFDDKYLSTIGVKGDRKVLHAVGPSDPVVLSVMLWDLAGGPNTGPVSRGRASPRPTRHAFSSGSSAPTTPGYAAQPATGLLSMVRAIVEQHGGHAQCRSRLGQGSTFGFGLPLA